MSLPASIPYNLTLYFSACVCVFVCFWWLKLLYQRMIWSPVNVNGSVTQSFPKLIHNTKSFNVNWNCTSVALSFRLFRNFAKYFANIIAYFFLLLLYNFVCSIKLRTCIHIRILVHHTHKRLQETHSCGIEVMLCHGRCAHKANKWLVIEWTQIKW